MSNTYNEVRRDSATGEYWLWEVISSDVEGEGGARRIDRITLVGLTQHELSLRQQIETLEAEVKKKKDLLVQALEYKQQIETAA